MGKFKEESIGLGVEFEVFTEVLFYKRQKRPDDEPPANMTFPEERLIVFLRKLNLKAELPAFEVSRQ